jgi:hypothetical protein
MLIDVASVTTAFVWPLFAALAGLAPLVVRILLGDQWTPVAALVGPLCLYASLNFAYAVLTSFAESFAYLRQIWVIQIAWTLVLVGSLGAAVVENADMRTVVLVAAAIMAAVHALQLAVLARMGSLDGVGTLRAELWSGAIAAVWYLATMLTNHEFSDRPLLVQVGASAVVLAILAAASLVALPHLPAGRAFANRGIRIALRPKLTQSS